MVDNYAPYRIKKNLEHSQLPQPILDTHPELIELYWKAWDIAWNHVLERKDTPEPSYMDPGMNNFTIWIWDTCFMAMFCRYAWQIFPGIQSLSNFYKILYDKVKAPIRIHFADNPPLFAWCESEYFHLTNDQQRLAMVLKEKQYLQKHFMFIETIGPRKFVGGVNCQTVVERYPYGYRWRGNTSGMDNSPRGRNKWNTIPRINPRGQIGYNRLLWVDLIAQQTLAAEKIAEIAQILGEASIAQEYTQKRSKLAQIINQYYWDPQDQIYYDLRPPAFFCMKSAKISPTSDRFNKVKTLASYWPMLAGVCTKDQAAALAKHAEDPQTFGGEIPWPSLARSDPEFDPRGRYWRGGVWLPTTYMATKALERYGYYQLADQMAERMVNHMNNTYQQFEPHTIWECYSPTESKPSTLKRNERFVEKDFCGWSALGPISMLIENVLGFHNINAAKREIHWRIHQKARHGIQNLLVGDIRTDLIYENHTLTIQSTVPYTLFVYSEYQSPQTLKIQKGEQKIPL